MLVPTLIGWSYNPHLMQWSNSLGPIFAQGVTDSGSTYDDKGFVKAGTPSADFVIHSNLHSTSIEPVDIMEVADHLIYVDF